MSGWDFDSNDKKKVEYTKFPTGITNIRIIDNEPHIRWVHWIQQVKRNVNCPGKDCPICKIRKEQQANKETPTYNMSRRFSMQILNRETEKIELMEQGITFFEDIRDLMRDLKEEGKALIDVDLKVRRRGTSKDDTSYRIDIAKEYPISDKDKKEIENKLDLSEYFTPHTPEQITALISGSTWEEVMYNDSTSEEDEKEEEIELS